jgi:drug/metabolite transporter (DMT)-like permease
MSSPSTVHFGPLRLSSSAAGALCCLAAVLGYSVANACMCQLSKWSCLSTWAVCNKELITVAVVGPCLLWQVLRGKTRFPTGRPLVILIAAGLSTELIGNLGVQWGFGVVGMAVMIPADTGFILVSTAILGGFLLGERVTARNLAAIGLLILAVALLGIGASRSAPATAAAPASPIAIAAAIAVACAVGIVYSLLGIAIRYCVTGAISHSVVVVIITGMGVMVLGPASFISAGATKLFATPLEQYALMFAAGVCNLVAFLALVRGLQLTTVLHVNLLNAGQVAIAAVVGVLLFGDTCNRWLVMGIGLMIVGVFVFGSPAEQEAFDAHV